MDTSSEQLIEKLSKGEIRFHDLDGLIGYKRAAEIRLLFLKKKLSLDFSAISFYNIDPEKCKPNIENMIGAVQVPLGIAGHVNVKGDYANGEFYIPLATTEGALVASVNRGCNVINKAGGADVLILEDEQSRSILFKAKSLSALKKFIMWIESNREAICNVGETDESHLKIKDLETYAVGLNIWLRIKASTDDAMGMNMITIAGKKIGDHISKNFEGVEFLSETGNMCTDKKPSAMNLINSRGKKVIASADIPEELISGMLRTTSDKLIDMNYRKNLLGSAASGSLGFNAHFANIIAAVFIATGQDAAHVVDGSLGFTTVEKTEGGVSFSVTLPDLQVGTIGGGTGLPVQKECLTIMGVSGPGNNNSKKFAEIVAAAVLAGEISLLGALCTKDLGKAHAKLNR